MVTFKRAYDESDQLIGVSYATDIAVLNTTSKRSEDYAISCEDLGILCDFKIELDQNIRQVIGFANLKTHISPAQARVDIAPWHKSVCVAVNQVVL